MIAYSVQSSRGRSLWLADSLHHTLRDILQPELALDWLLYSCSSTRPISTLRVFWSLDQAVSLILSLLPESTRKSISETSKATWGNYRLFYIPSKKFCITKSHDEVSFYDLSQYFPEDSAPSTVDGIQEKADLLAETLEELGMPARTTLVSPVAVAVASGGLGDFQRDIPTVFDAPSVVLEAFEYALQYTPREWVSAYQVGHWGEGELWDYDITSAYPYEASRLIDLRDCQFTKSDIVLESAYYGFLYGDLYISSSHPYAFCSPVRVNRGDGQLVNAVGRLPTDFYPLDLVRFIRRYQMGEFKLKLGWFVSPYPAVRPRFPFRDLMADLYSRRSFSPLASYFLKRVMNGIVGKLLETREVEGEVVKYGGLYNPIYHALITSATKIRVAEFVIQNEITERELVHVGVDGIKSTKRIYLPSQSFRMGQWVCRGSQPTVVLSPGRVYTTSRPDGGIAYQLLRGVIRARPNSKRYSFDGTVVDLNALRMDPTRLFPKFPRTGRDLLSRKYQSEAIVL